jgi:hypothetical protein
MGDRFVRTAVGAGTTAGGTPDARSEVDSRAAEAETDAILESLRVTGAGIPAACVPEHQSGSGGDSDSPPGPVAHVRPEGRRDDLAQNQAGIASRIE